MIVRQFILSIQSASAGERAEATRSLARAYLFSALDDADRSAAESALLMQLDDASPLVRRAMAEVFAYSDDAPPAVVQALAADQPSIATLVLEHSPLMMDADLVDIVATGACDIQCAVARRVDLPASVSAAIAEVGRADAVLELIRNPHAELAPFSWDRIVERHGHVAAIREYMLALDGLPSATRLALVAKLSQSLTRFVVARNWLGAERAERIAADALDRSTVLIAGQCDGDDMHGLVGHLRRTGQLTAGLILRALLAGNTALFERALSELTDLPQNRVAALLYDRGGAGIDALLARAGFAAAITPAFRAALEAIEEFGFAGAADSAARLRRRMVERVLTRCESDETVAEPLLVLLRRYAAESAREEARTILAGMTAADAVAPDRYGRMAA